MSENRPRYYTRAGVPMTLEEWARAVEREDRHIGDTTLPNGRRVSTVWLGLDHNFGQGLPLIFETMVFGPDELDCQRYSTEDEACAGHQAMIEKWLLAEAARG